MPKTLKFLETRYNAVRGILFGELLVKFFILFFLIPIHALAEDIPSEQWSRYIRSIRKDHQFILSAASSQGIWRGHMGSLDGNFPAQGFSAHAGFQFHLPIADKLAYFLGSTIGIQQESISHPHLSIPYILHLPGAVIGIALNINPKWSIQSQVDYALLRTTLIESDFRLAERSNEVKIRDAEIDLSLDSLTWSNSFHYFYQLDRAIQFEISQLWVWYRSPAGQSDQILSDTQISKKGFRYSIGIIYHLL